MSKMFKGCSSLKELNLSSFNNKKVTDMIYMFKGCSSLKKFDISNFISNKYIMKFGMFEGCSSKLSLKCKNNLIKTEYKNKNLFF